MQEHTLEGTADGPRGVLVSLRQRTNGEDVRGRSLGTSINLGVL